MKLFNLTHHLFSIVVWLKFNKKSKLLASNSKLKFRNRYKRSQINFSFIVFQNVPEPPPISPFFRPFWLMRLFIKSIESGSYITPKIYVPKTVWFQAGAKIVAMGTKSASWETINESLVKIKDIGENNLDTLGRVSCHGYIKCQYWHFVFVV